MAQKKNAPAIQKDSQSAVAAQIVATGQHAANSATGHAHCVIQFNFGGQPHSFNAEGWFNATEAAVRFGRLPNDWLRLPGTVSYLAAFKRKYGNIPHLKTRRGVGGGTWLHPKLAVRFAQWLNDDFAVWCDEQIDTIVRNNIRAEGNANLLPLFLREMATVWEIRFKPDYYRALAKLTNSTYTGHAGGTSPIYGHITDQWVYACILPGDVHAALKARRGKSSKMHQWLTQGGQAMLDKQIDRVTDIARSSTGMRDFQARMMAVSDQRGQTGFIFPRVA